MGKAMKWLGIGVAGLLLVLVGLMVAVPLLVDPNDYKESMAAVVQERTGRQLSIPGEINLSVSMQLKVVFGLGQISLSNGLGFPVEDFAAAEQARIELALWPLLSARRLEVQTLVLDGLRVNLHRRADGSSNWQDLLATETPVKQEQEQQAAAPALSGLEIGGIRLTNISVDLVDEQAGQRLTLREMAVTAGPISSGASFPLRVGFGLDLEQQGVRSTARVDLESELTLDVAEQRFRLADLKFQGRLQRPGLPEGGLELTGEGHSEIDLKKQLLTVDDLELRLGAAEVHGALRLEDFAALKMEATLTIPNFSPKSLAESLGLELPAFQAADALTRLGADLEVRGDRQRLEIAPLNVKFDQTTFKGKAVLAGLTTKPSYEVVMHGDRLDLDRYTVKAAAGVDTAVAAQASGQKAQKGQEAKEAQGAQLIPVELLRDLGLRGDLRLDSLKGGGAELTQVVIQTTVADGRLHVKPLSASLYGGTLHVEAEVDARTDNPKLHLQKKLQQVNLGELAQAMTGRDEFSGTLNMDTAVTSRGATRDDIVSHANGKLNLSCTDGEIKKLKILKVIRTARALYRGEAIPALAQEEATGFARLTATGVIQNGVIFNEDLYAASELMAVNGRGKVDLVNEHLDYQLDVRMARALNRNETTGLAEFGDRVIPYRISGPFSDLKQNADVADLLKGEVKDLLMKELGKKLDPTESATEGTAPSLLEKGLKGLFGN